MLRRALTITCVFAALTVAAATLSATTINRATYFTFNQPVRVTGVLLPAGNYVFEIANPYTSANVVRISDRKKTKTYVIAVTRHIVRRSARQLDAVIVFGEVSARAPRKIQAWFPADVTTGYEFVN